jgi:hypothetical protein
LSISPLSFEKIENLSESAPMSVQKKS